MVESTVLLGAAEAAPVPATIWRALFIVGCYTMAAGCLFRGIREGARAEPPHSPWKEAIGQGVLFGFLVFAFWLVESWAHHRTPFYLYSTAFTDLVPRFPFEALGWPRAVESPCTQMVLGLASMPHADRIPLSVLLLEASLTYSALWTARLLGANLAIQPFLAALVLVNVDALLDPVVATAHSCTDGTLLERPGIGLGFWRWYVDPGSIAEWYGVPIFNYAAWFAAPVFLISLVNLGGGVFAPWVLSRFRKSLRDPEKAPRGREVIALVTMGGMVAFLHWLVPRYPATLGVGAQKAAMLGLLGTAALLVFAKPARWETDEHVDVTLTQPASIALAVPALALLFEGFFVKTPQLIPVGIFAFAFAMVFAFAPYRRTIRSFCDRVARLDRFTRLHYFGFTSMLVLLGAGLLRVKPEKGMVGGLLLVALCFHVWSYVLNDVVDLELDRSQPRRREDPLVKGTVTRPTALALAVLQVPLAALATLHLLGFQPRANPWACAVLGAGFALILVYNLWGKAFRFPPLADLIQGLGWGSLVVFGALVANRDHPDFWPRTAPLLAYTVGFILLISGVHGGLRDLWTDGERRLKTTTLFLGARRSTANAGVQPVQSTRRLALYAFAVHTAMFLLAFSFLWSPPENPEELFFSAGVLPFAWVVVAGSFVLSSVMLWLVVKIEPSETGRDRVMSLHALVLLLPPLGLYLLSEIPDDVFQIVVASCFFVPLLLQEDILPGAIRFLYRDLHPFLPARVAGRTDPDVEWARLRNLHDVVYWDGGIRGGLVPWRTRNGWEWRYAGSNLAIATYMWRRWGRRAREEGSLGRRTLLRIGQLVLPLLYAVTAMLLGWTTWSLTRRKVSKDELDTLGGLGEEQRKSLERWI